MVSAIVTAAGKNRRMREDLKSKNLSLTNKLLLDLKGMTVIEKTIENVLNSGVKKCIIVVGHHSNQIIPVINQINDERIVIIKNPDFNVELSQSLYNGLVKSGEDICLCLAGDQPTITTNTMLNLIMALIESRNTKNFLSVLSRGESGFLTSAEGLGMPFVCHSETLKKYMKQNKSNLNPILREMFKDGITFYGVEPQNSLELININRYQDYLKVLSGIN